MKIAVFTCNQPRHLDLIRRLAAIADEVFAVQETKTGFPGQRDAIHPKSEVLADYFRRMQDAERAVFGPESFSPSNVRSMALYMGDASHFPLSVFAPALDADVYVVFGASYLRGPLVEALVAKRAINIHMGVSPYYRGSACNFWALADGRPELVGSTIHLLTAGLDSGPILFHAMPRPAAVDGFALGMHAVRAANGALAARIADGSIHALSSVPQDRGRELRYSRSREFTDEVAADYLGRALAPAELAALMASRREDEMLKDPVFL
ncbi:MAG: methionyl-tRNA formyltransferase [Alphaproteobacteria bacterium]|nr:methionyl-tRNA formyltransferase [Alphaproteobacteria bacterium]